jgi:hypothetical protein
MTVFSEFAKDTSIAPAPPKLDRAWLRVLPALVLLVIILAGGTLLFLFNPSVSGIYPVCLFHSATGLLCPGCGSLRAIHQLLHGHMPAAFKCNALLVSAIPLAAGLFLQNRFMRPDGRVFSFGSNWLWLAGAIIVFFGIFRNLPIPQASWFQP